MRKHNARPYLAARVRSAGFLVRDPLLTSKPSHAYQLFTTRNFSHNVSNFIFLLFAMGYRLPLADGRAPTVILESGRAGRNVAVTMPVTQDQKGKTMSSVAQL